MLPQSRQEVRMSRLRFLAVFFLLLSPSVFAQTTGNLNGKVTDSNGAVPPGVTVELKSAALQGTRSATSDREGVYRFALLPPGDYAVAFRLEGLAPELCKNE